MPAATTPPATTTAAATTAAVTEPSGTTTATTTKSSTSLTDQFRGFVDSLSAGKPMDSGSYGIFILIFLAVLSIVVLVSTGSIIAVLVVWALIALVVTVLAYYGLINLESKQAEEKPEAKLAPPVPSNGVGQEVFHVSQNQFTYDEAPAVCAAYGSQLASLEQVIEAYNGGAEWCGYGWSAGGMALYPTQKKTWTELQREIDPGKRTACGRPGVNGGYMDPSLKLGVNCFGFKPLGDFTPPAPVPGTDKKAFDDMVSKFKDMLNTMQLSPFSRNEWSGYDSTVTGQAVKGLRSAGAAASSLTEKFTTQSVPGYGSQFQQDLGRLVEPFEPADPTVIEAANTIAAYDPKAPYGLRGNPGERGPAGPASTVAGPPGGPGPQGPQGPQGSAGSAGAAGAASTVPGPEGRQGERGPTGAKGDPGAAYSGPMPLPGRAGEKGEKGERGEVGPKGDPGSAGSADKDIIADTRSVNSPPSDYWKRGAGVYREFKGTSVVGLTKEAPTLGPFGTLETIVPWGDPTGGPIRQKFMAGAFTLERGSTSTSAWGGWKGTAYVPTGLTTQISSQVAPGTA